MLCCIASEAVLHHAVMITKDVLLRFGSSSAVYLRMVCRCNS